MNIHKCATKFICIFDVLIYIFEYQAKEHCLGFYLEPTFCQAMSIAGPDQRTSGPVNAHLTPGPGIYFNAFIHVYSPRAGQGQTIPWGQMLMSTESPCHCPSVASFKTIALKV